MLKLNSSDVKEVRQGGDWDLVFEDKVYKTVKARDLYNLMAENAFTHNEPGIFNVDHINRYNNGFWAFDINEVNPCVAEGTLVNTPSGFRKVEDIKVGDLISTLHRKGYEPVKEVEIHENKWVNEVILSDGSTQYVTDAHIYHVKKKGKQSSKIERLRCDQIFPGDKIQFKTYKINGEIDENSIEYKKALLAGILLGDGSYSEDSIKSNNTIKIATNIDEENYNTNLTILFDELGLDYKFYHYEKEGKSASFILRNAKEILENLELKALKSFEKEIPFSYMNDINKASGVINGLLASDGNINIRSGSTPMIRFKQSSENLVQSIRKTMLNLGIKGSMYIEDKNFVKNSIIDGREIKTNYDKFTFVIQGTEVNNFVSTLPAGIHPDKEKKLNDSNIFYTHSGSFNTVTVKQINWHVKKEKVYDLFCEESDTWITEGVVQQGCGEIVMPRYSICCLSALNLGTFVKNKFQDDAYFDFEEFAETTKWGVRFLDNVLSVAKYPLKKIEENALGWRRIGLGITALGNVFQYLGVAYGSDESKEITEKIAKTLRDSSYRSSAELASEKGRFPFYDERFNEAEFVKGLDDDDVRNLIKKNGMRNIALNTIAPTGTISLSIGQNCSSGIEPTFALSYTRNYRTGNEDEMASEAVYDRAWLEYIEHLDSPDMAKKLLNGDEVKLEKPEWFSVAADVNPYDSIDIQAIFQKYIDHSISKCVAKGTLISTNKGLIPIEELSDFVYDKPDTFSDVNDDYYVIDENGDRQKIKSHYYNGKQKGIHLQFSNGMEIDGSYVHKLKTPGGWVTLDNLQVGDSVFYRKSEIEKNVDYIELEQPDFYNHIKIKYPKVLDEDFAKFLGMLIADGNINNSGISICEKNQDVNNELTRLFGKLFNKEKIRIDKRNDVRSHELYSRSISKLMKQWVGADALTKKVPMEILKSKKSVQLAFIEGLTLDGCITQGDHLLIYEGYSKDVRDKVGHMLGAMGLRYYLGDKKVPNGKLSQISWSVRVYLDDRIITPIEKHKQDYILSNHSHENVYFPEELVDEYMKLPKSNSDDYNDRRNLRRSLRTSSFVRRSLLEHLNLMNKLDKDLIELKVVSKEYIDEVEMYDIEVENSHSYLIGGIISHNTLNLPPGTSIDEYNDLFMYAYKKGLKGFTTFNPEGSMKGILEYNEPKEHPKNESSPDHVERHMAPDRPNELPCDIHEITVQGHKHLVLVGKLRGSLYEVFVDDNTDGEVDVNHHKEGIIKKNGRGKYSLVIKNGTERVVVENLAKEFDGTYGSLARMVSMALRHGTPLQFIVEQLQKSKQFISFERAVARVLKKYIKDGEIVQTGEVCPECEGKLNFKEGCVSCNSCGWSRCS